jgi:hypothetical protein
MWVRLKTSLVSVEEKVYIVIPLKQNLPGEKYLNLRQISNFCKGLPAWLSKFSNYSLIGIHPT